MERGMALCHPPHQMRYDMAERLYTLRALKSFVDYSIGGTPVSVGKGAIIQRTEKEATRLDNLAELVPSYIEQMVMSAKDSGCAFVTSNPEVIAVCKEFGVAYTDPNGKGKQRAGNGG